MAGHRGQRTEYRGLDNNSIDVSPPDWQVGIQGVSRGTLRSPEGYEAYHEVQRNLSRLIMLGQLRPAMELCPELMKQGSHQVEMSDEGLMTQGIEACFSVVVKALKKKCDLPPSEVIAWCDGMAKSDRVGDRKSVV